MEPNITIHGRNKYNYFLPLFDRQEINIVFFNALKVRSCIALPDLQFKNYSLEKKKQNTCFAWNAASASDFRNAASALLSFTYMIRTKSKST